MRDFFRLSVGNSRNSHDPNKRSGDFFQQLLNPYMDLDMAISDTSSAVVRVLVSFYLMATDDTYSSSARTVPRLSTKRNSMFRYEATNTTTCTTS